ncbi:hypothetical protein [Aquimarina litoralis]|uniref:hypothetical protein n=1 Tax=Aquimarina litoralis TaxID=584605 RepID=UPI001C59C5A5|nr:hypothetical protein [Aquimarina litoralis]MBW1294750.1 hypothetical protein [Aquimarina litoralis]
MKKLIALCTLLLICLFANGQEIKEVSQNWSSFSQSVKVETDSVRKFKVIAHVKVETEDPKAQAGVWARVDNKPDQGRGFFDNMRNRPIKSNTWNSYTIQGILNDKSEKLVFGGIFYNNGTFFYDKFELYIEDDEGVFQPVEIKNPGFETEITDRTIPEWTPGIGRNEITLVQEFTFTSSKDSVDGTYSLAIDGKGISKNTGSIEGFFPNIGIVITIVLIMLLIIPLLTYASSTDDEKWSLWSRIGFRFSFIYFLLLIFFQNNGAYPFFYYLAQKPVELMEKFVPWLGEHILGIPFKIKTGPNGSGDTSFDYLVVFFIFLIAIVGTLIWSAIDRKRTNYKTLYYWLTTALRYYVGLMLISYGLVKVIQLQFSAPSFYRLLETYGESSPMGLAWTFLGFSKGYNLFMGIAEVLAGLLLFRRTTTFGAIITLMTAMNVMAVNYFFDVPVKILSTHLVIMTLFILSRDLRKVMEFLVTNKQVEKLTIIQQPTLHKGVRIGLNVTKGLIVAYALGYGFYSTLAQKESYGLNKPKPPLYGVYEVTNYVVNGDTLTNYKSDKRWKNIRFEREGSVQIEKMNKQRANFSIEIDSTANGKIKFIPSSGGSDSFDFRYTKTETTLDFNFIHKNDTISGQTTKMGEDKFLLVNRGFHWISERPYNR